MKIVRNSLLPPGRRYAAINLFGVLLVKHGVELTPELLNHEAIHTRQMRELLYLPFYLAYVAEWLVLLFRYCFDGYRAYRAISFEREAYTRAGDLSYLGHRRHFAQWRREHDGPCGAKQ